MPLITLLTTLHLPLQQQRFHERCDQWPKVELGLFGGRDEGTTHSNLNLVVLDCHPDDWPLYQFPASGSRIAPYGRCYGLRAYHVVLLPRARHLDHTLSMQSSANLAAYPATFSSSFTTLVASTAQHSLLCTSNLIHTYHRWFHILRFACHSRHAGPVTPALVQAVGGHSPLGRYSGRWIATTSRRPPGALRCAVSQHS